MITNDFQYFKENRDQIIKDHLEEFVVIKDGKIIDYYKTEKEALQVMVEKKIELGSFIVQKCVTAEEGKVMFYTRRVVL
jgi:hypothetical protein